MRVWLRHNRTGLCIAVAALLTACSTAPTPEITPATETPAPTTASAAGLSPVAVQVAPDLAQTPFDEPREALVPAGWTLSVWARMPRPRLATWTPDGALLVSVPSAGEVVALRPGNGSPTQEVLLDGLDQPHGLTFAGNSLYVAESDQVDV